MFGTNGQTGTHDTPLFAGPGVIVGRKGAGHLGVHWTDNDYWVIDTAYSLVPKTQIDLRFAYYLLNYVGLDHLKHGTSNPSLTREAFGAQYFPVPPFEEQRAIAGMLDALDRRIESNHRAISLIENLSRSIFRQWRATTPTDRMMTFGAFADVYGGATPKTTVAKYWDGELAWATPTDVTALSAPYLFSTGRRITAEGLANCSATLHPVGTIFMTSRATIGEFAINMTPAATNQGFIAVRPRRSADRWFLFEEMRSRIPEFLDNANGSTFMELSRGRFRDLPLSLPGREQIDALATEIAPLHTKATQLSGESRRIAHLRQTLLPELVSGRIRGPAEATE